MAGLGTDDETTDVVAWLSRSDATGKPIYNPQDVADVIPVLLLMSGQGELPDHLAELLGGFALHLGIGPQTAPEEMGQRLRAYLASGAINLELWKDTLSFLARNRQSNQSAAETCQKLYRSFMGETPRRLNVDAAIPAGASEAQPAHLALLLNR